MKTIGKRYYFCSSEYKSHITSGICTDNRIDNFGDIICTIVEKNGIEWSIPEKDLYESEEELRKITGRKHLTSNKKKRR